MIQSMIMSHGHRFAGKSMRDRESFKLIGGPYAMPRCSVGGVLTCEARGRDVTVGGIHDARISWPYMKGRSRTPLILCGDLIRAVQMESAIAVAHNWGISRSTVCIWRRELGVPKWNPGTTRLSKVHMSAAKRGRPALPQFRAAALRAARRPKSEAWKRQLSARLRKEWAPGGVRRLQVEKRWRKRRRAVANR